MRIGIIGAGRIGGNVARQAARVGHEVVVSFARDEERLRDLAGDIGARVESPAGAGRSDIVVLAVPWSALPQAIEACGDLAGRIVIDTTNHFGPGPAPALGQTAAAFNAARLPGARYTKSFNTLTAAFQARVAGREGDDRVVQWICGDDASANAIVAGFIAGLGYAPVDLGPLAGCAVMESPRRAGAVYGEEYRLKDGLRAAAALRAGEALPPTPAYDQR